MKTPMHQVRLAVDHAERCYSQQLTTCDQTEKGLRSIIDNKDASIRTIKDERDKAYSAYFSESDKASKNLYHFILSCVVSFISIGYIVYTM